MELRQLRSFAKAAETLNFSEASRALFITQSTLSLNIKKLEEELKIPLFHRNSHEVSLTDAGMELLPIARQILQQADNCIDHANDLLNLRHGTLNIGVTHSFSLLTTETVVKFVKEYPGIQLHIFHKTMNELMDMLTKRELDFVLSYKPSQPYRQIESHTLFEDKLSVVVNPQHALAQLDKICIDDIMKFQLALPSKGLQARNMLDQILEDRNLEAHIRIEFNEINPLLQLVRSSSLVTILSGASVETQSNLKAIPLETDLRMIGSFHILKDAYHKQSAKEFIRMLCETNIIKKRMSTWF